MGMRSVDQDPTTIHLHLGAHKTATTYIQTELGLNARILASDGVTYIPMRAFRAWRRTLSRFGARVLGPPGARFDRRLQKWNPERSRTCIVSDENTIGTCGDIVGTGKLYPNVRSKLGAVAAMLYGHEVRLFISIRGYPSFYAAAYGEALRYGEGCSSEIFKRRLDPAARRWPDVLAEIADLFPSSPITVWPYETFAQCRTQIFDALAGTEIATRLGLSREVLRPSPSHDAVDRAERFAGRFGWRLAGRFMPLFESRAPASPPFDPWTETERRELQQLYAADLEEIGSNGRYRMIAPHPVQALPVQQKG